MYTCVCRCVCVVVIVWEPTKDRHVTSQHVHNIVSEDIDNQVTDKIKNVKLLTMVKFNLLVKPEEKKNQV